MIPAPLGRLSLASLLAVAAAAAPPRLAPRVVPPAPAADAPLPRDHWTRPLLSALRFAPDSPANAITAAMPPPATRWDAALRLARWLEAGAPSPGARPRLLATHYARDLARLGLPADRVAAALARRAPAASAASAPGGHPALKIVRESLTRHERLEAKIRELQARRKP